MTTLEDAGLAEALEIAVFLGVFGCPIFGTMFACRVFEGQARTENNGEREEE